MSDIERCARALHQRDVDDPACEPDQREWDRLTVALQDQYRADAQAVLDAANHQGAVEDRDRLQRVVDEAYAAADGEDETTLSRVLEVLAPHVEAGEQ